MLLGLRVFVDATLQRVQHLLKLVEEVLWPLLQIGRPERLRELPNQGFLIAEKLVLKLSRERKLLEVLERFIIIIVVTLGAGRRGVL